MAKISNVHKDYCINLDISFHSNYLCNYELVQIYVVDEGNMYWNIY